jgi:serine/threonine-protein kinase
MVPFDLSENSNAPCVVQEFIEGGDLADLLATQVLPVRRGIELAIQFCDGMQFAHETLGIIHRDIKSSNCLLTSAGKLKITDFGLARSFSDTQAFSLDISALDPATRVQYTVPLGTLAYMAPEQLDAEAHLDIRTDIHAFGVMLYEMLTRDLAFYYPPGACFGVPRT